jgi:two-component system response regulator
MSRSRTAILIVDDDDGYCELVRRHLKRGGITHPMLSVKNGRTALDFVFCRGTFVDRSPLVHLLVLLDINMPGIDGIEVLRQIKSDPKTRTIPVLMLTTAADQLDINRCYEYGCSAYIAKSVDSTELIEMVRRFCATTRVH